jgi:hypothetical protein
MLVYISLLLFRICKQEEERRRRGLSSALPLPKLYHFDLNHEMKADLLSSHSHQAHTRKCPHLLPTSSNRHRWLCPHHLCCWFQHRSATQWPTSRWAKSQMARLNIEVLEYLCSALCLQSCVRNGRSFWKHGGKQHTAPHKYRVV